MVSQLTKQVGGEHYKSMAIQPIIFCQDNNLNACESNIVKYACRHKQKGRKEDLLKVIHYAQMLIELEYSSEVSKSTPTDEDCDRVAQDRPSEQTSQKPLPFAEGRRRSSLQLELPLEEVTFCGHVPEDLQNGQWYVGPSGQCHWLSHYITGIYNLKSQPKETLPRSESSEA